MSDTASIKKRLRSEMLARRAALSSDEIAEKSAGIIANIRSYPEFDLSGTVALYSPIRNEVLVDPLLSEVGVAVYPRVEGDDLVFCRICGADELECGCFGVSEPKSETPIIAHHELTLIIVPGCGYTLDGCRLGYGGGFYDRLFSKIPQTIRLSPAFEMQLINDLPMQEHDKYVDFIVTEERVIATAEYRKEKPK